MEIQERRVKDRRAVDSSQVEQNARLEVLADDLNQERRRARQLELALRGSEDRLRLLDEGLQEYAIILLDAQGNISSWSHGAERVFGYREDEILGQPASRLFPSEDVRNGRYERELWTAATSGRSSD